MVFDGVRGNDLFSFLCCVLCLVCFSPGEKLYDKERYNIEHFT